MKKINLFSRLWSSGGNSQSTDVGYDSRATVGRPSGLGGNSLLKLVSVLVLMLTVGVGNAWGAEQTAYTLSGTTTGSTSGYADESSITQSSKNWVVLGNTGISPWRIGGAKKTSGTNENRYIYSQTAITENITKVVVTHGSKSSMTVNSVTLNVYSTAAKAVTGGTGDISSVSVTYVDNGNMTFSRPAGHNWAGRFFRIDYDLTWTYNGSSARYILFSSAAFKYDDTPACTSISPSLSYASVGGTTLTIGSSSSGSPTITGNTGSGTVTYSSNNTSVATVNSSTGVVTAVAAGNATITASIAAKGVYCEGSATANFTITVPAYTVQFSTGTGNPTVSSRTEASAGAGITLPAGPTPACSSDGWNFAGWGYESCDDESTEPTLYIAGNKYYPSSNETLYAVYVKGKTASTNYKLISDAAQIVSGENYVIAAYYNSNDYAITAEIQSSYYIQQTAVTVNASNIIANPGATIIWQLTKETGSNVSLYNSNQSKYLYVYASSSYRNLGLYASKKQFTMTEEREAGYASTFAFKSTDYTSYYINYDASHTDFGTKTSSDENLYLYKRQYTGTFDSNPTCKDVKSIAVQTAPTKLTYCAGDMFDPTGLVIRVTYTDDSYENVAYSGHESDFSFTPSTSTALTTGNTSVTITYRSDKSTTQAITVNTAYTITLTGSGTVTGGTISADNSSACAGSTITLTATPNTHYTFSSWNVTSGGSPVTVTSNQFTMPSGNVTVNATFTEDAYRTVVFKSNKQALFDDGGSATTFDGTNKWKQKVYLTEKPVWPTDLISGQACDATSTEFKGWVADGQTWTGKEASVPGGSTLITSASGFAAAASGSGDVVYHAVWAKGTSSVVEQTASFGFEEASPSAWTITNIVQYNTYKASGSYSGKCKDNGSGTIVTPNTIQYNAKLSTPISISFKSSKSNNKSNDSNWHVQSSSDGSSWSTVTDGTGPTNSELSQGVFSDPFEVDLSSLSNVYIRIEHGGSSPASLLDDIVLSYSAGGTTYSDYLTTCCENLVAISDGTLSHCTLSYSNTSQPTCSETASDRQVTITVTPDAGYEMTSSARLTWTKTSGTAATATHVSGPTGSGPYTFIYKFDQNDNGEGTFDATCTPKTYRITLNNNGATTTGTEYVDVVYNTAPATFNPPAKEGYNFQGYWTNTGSPSWGSKLGNNGGTWAPNIANYTSSGNWIKAADVTLYAKWEEKSLQNYRTECPSFGVYNQDGESAADIHLTSTKDVEIYASQAAGNLIRIIASGLDAYGNHPKIGVEYYDANNEDALVTGTDRVFRLCSSDTYNTENDLLDLGENTTEYDQTFSISYTPKDYGQSHHYKLKLILRNNNTEKDNITIHLYGRSLPKEFVIAAKSGDTWYALPNTLAATEGAQGAISPTAITVDNATTPTKVVNPVGTVIYGACNKYTNDNRSGLRFTSDGAHWIQTSSTASVYKMWLSNTGYTNAQDWYLKSTDLSAYEVFMDPIGSPDDKRRIELYNSSGVKMGYHNTGSGNARTGIGNIYLLPVEFPSITARIMEWGTDHVVVELRTPGSSTKVKTQIGGGAIGDEQSLESVKKDEGVYRLAVTLSSNDALKDLKLYFYNISDVLQGVAEFTIPRIVSSTTTTGSFGTPFKKDAPFVDLVILNGATLTVSETTDGTKFTFRDLYVYGNAKMVVPSGTYIDFSNVYLRGGHLNSSWNYVYSHPQLVLNGTMGNTSNTINYDYLTNNAQFYSLALPYDVTLSTIVNPDFNNKQSWLIHAYDGALRASGSQVSGWYDVEEGSTTGSIAPLGPTDELTAGVGYTFFGAPQKVNSIRQKWSVNRFPMTLASGSAEVAKSGVSVTAHGMTESAGVYTLNDGVAPNDAGWNMLGNPFLADIGGTETYETAVKGTILSYHNVKTMDASGNWTGGWHWEENETNVRYVRIPNDLGTEYEQVRFKDATLRAFHHFFIQAGATGTFNFDLATRAQSMPQRIKRGKLLLPEEMDVDFRLSKGEASTKFGLTLCDDFSSDYVMNEDIAEDLSGEAMKAYTLILDQRVTYNGLPFTAAQQIIPVGFRAPNAGEYTFSYQEDENSENIEHIYLTDMRLGVVTDLKDNTYKFASEIGVVDNRFVLQIVFSSNVTTDVEETFEQENGRPVKFIYQDRIYILRNGIIYDITGKRVKEINK